MNKDTYIKTDENVVVNEKYIRWIKKVDECMEICSRFNGCSLETSKHNLRVCKLNNPDSYKRMEQLFR